MRALLRIATLALLATTAFTQVPQINDRVRLESTNVAGVPVHPAAGDNSYVRWANDTVGKVTAIDSTTGWFKIESAGKVGWITERYLTVVPPDPDTPATPAEGTEIPTAVIGTWNLEHFHDGQSRGFPENTNGGPSYGTRTQNDLDRIATIIKTQLGTRILVLNEIYGRSGTTKSDEMDRLVAALGAGWQYDLTASGGSQRIAMLYDTALARKERCVELTFAELRIDGKDVFERDPLVCRFTLLKVGGQAQNDLIVVGLHLASGQQHVNNHNEAMRLLRLRLHNVLSDGTFPSAERDFLLAGDLNASRYDNKLENFWDGYDANGFKFVTLSPVDGEEYHPTRLAGVPLFPKSQIDYLIASGQTGGLGVELVQLLGEVHEELLLGGFDDFREHVSDHLPVTVRVRLIPDDD